MDPPACRRIWRCGGGERATVAVRRGARRPKLRKRAASHLGEPPHARVAPRPGELPRTRVARGSRLAPASPSTESGQDPPDLAAILLDLAALHKIQPPSHHHGHLATMETKCRRREARGHASGGGQGRARRPAVAVRRRRGETRQRGGEGARHGGRSARRAGRGLAKSGVRPSGGEGGGGWELKP